MNTIYESFETESSESNTDASTGTCITPAAKAVFRLRLSRYRRYLKKLYTRGLFYLNRLGRHAGFHILPVHFYLPVPDIDELRRTKDVWAKKSELPGIRIDLEEQVRNLTDVCMPYQREYLENRFRAESIENAYGPGFGRIEAKVLHAVIRHFRPKRIVEVGGGSSTYCSLKALELNSEEDGGSNELVCIEPFPSEPLKKDKRIHLIPEAVQKIGYDVFERLEERDLLFVDSTHTVKPGGDVNYLVLEVLPRLKAGVVVHFHDIFFPYDYQPSVLHTMFHWTETSLVRAFLTCNSRAGILFCLSHLHEDRPDLLKEIFPNYQPRQHECGLNESSIGPHRSIKDFPTSLYFKVL